MSQSRNPTTRNKAVGQRLDAAFDEGPKSRAGLIVSAVLHAGIILATLYTFSHRSLDIADEAPPVVPVDLVTIAPKTNIAPTVREIPKVVQQQIQPPQLDALKQPDLPAIHEQAEPPPPPDETASEPAIKKPPPPPVPKMKPQTQQPAEKPPKKNTSDDFSALLNQLAAPSAAPANARVAQRTTKGIGQQDAMTMDLVDALRNQIAQCWNAPVGSPHPEQLIVSLEVFLNPDGSVAQPPQLTGDSQAAAASDPFMRAAADAAKRAIYVCAPYKLPGDRYSTWRDLDVTFDPRKMMGG